MIDALEELELAYPKVDANKRAELKLVQAELEGEVAGKAKGGKQGKKAKGAKQGKRGEQGKQGKGAGLAADDGASPGDGAGQRDSRTAHRAVGTEGRGATTGTV